MTRPARAARHARALVAAAIAAAFALLVAPRAAAADTRTITIGLYAPTAPFDSAGDRVSFVDALATHLAGDAGGARVVGKVYATAAALTAAIKARDVQFAVVDAPYAAGAGLPYRALATATRDGSGKAAWRLVAGAGVRTLADLRGERLALPATGGKDAAFVTNALLGGEVDAAYFDKLVTAADPRSALALVEVDKAAAAVVPAGVELPSGLRVVMTLRDVGWPMFVATPAADAADAAMIDAFAARVRTFGGSGPFTGFTAAEAGDHAGLAASFARPRHRPPMVVPAATRLAARELVGERRFELPLTDVLTLVEAPPAPAPAPSPAARAVTRAARAPATRSR